MMIAGKKRSSINSDIYALQKEWDEALCPICMEHPHNAVLLLCSSLGKGCRPYICDTSYRHSNCLDRYRKMKMDSSSPLFSQHNPDNTPATSGALAGDNIVENLESHHPRERSSRVPGHIRLEDFEIGDFESSTDRTKKMNLQCPLCRGEVQGWKVVEEARKFLNMKTRSCSGDSCSFVGNYQELRRHARGVHPSARPAETDPSRKRTWRCLEIQREYDDIVTSLRSAMPGAVVLGDYVLENDDNDNATERGGTSAELSGPFWTSYLFFQMLAEPRSHSRGTWSSFRRVNEAPSRRRRYLWGENLLGVRDPSEDEGDYPVNDHVNESSVGRRHREEASGVDIEDDDLPMWRRRRLT